MKLMENKIVEIDGVKKARLEEIEILTKERDLYKEQLNYVVCMKDKVQMLQKMESLNKAISLIKSFM
mgnify:CR=1 FL=1